MEQNEQVSSMRLASPKDLIFSTFSKEEVCNLSVVKVITPLTFDAVGHPLPGGLYDPAMGPLQGGVCTTCGMMTLKCSGHMGHIELPLPVLNPIYHKPVGALLKTACLQCHRILVPHPAKCLLIGQLDLLHHGYLAEAQEMESVFADLVQFDSWDNVDDISVKAFTVNRVDDYVTSVKSQKEPFAKEWKGEVDFRNAYIKAALSRIYKGKNCPYCRSPLKKLTIVNNSIYVPSKVQVASKFQAEQTNEMEVTSSNFTFMTPSECKDHLKKLFDEDGSFMRALLPVIAEIPSDPIERLFVEVIPVPSLNARPVNFTDGRLMEHPQNYVYKAILEDCMIIRTLHHLMKIEDGTLDQDDSEVMKQRLETVDKLRGKTNGEKLQNTWVRLQKNVDSLLDIDVLKQRNSLGTGLKQIIEKKQGLIRMNMMGKRVNFAARTVITPDPNLNIDEIGVPEAFAKKLSYPVPVTYYNVHELRKFIINGPFCHPGANLVENEDGHIVKLDGGDLSQREGIAKKLLTPSVKKGIKIVHRHLLNGDILLLNRQPTLHKPSIMAHKARVLKGERTFRMHYANCKSYNADFDGDEMNAHFPQNEVARSEGYNLVSVGKQYLVPKDGTPLSGLIQDHVISGVRLSIRGKFFTQDEYMQLCFIGLSSCKGNIKTLPPCMIKPAQLWSGKQIISTIILNVVPKGYAPVNLTSTAKIGAKAWPTSKNPTWRAGGSLFRNHNDMTEAEVIIRGGELLCGVLDKMHYGATPYSLVHCMHELYGSDSASRLLSSFSKLFTAFLQTEGFTLGVEDILVVKQADAERRKIIDEVRKIGDEVAIKALDRPSKNLREDLAEAHRKDPMFRAVLDHQYKMSLDSFTNNINKTCLPSGLQKTFPANDLQLMVQSGAKGSTVNTMQISCLLGQIELEGKRPPLMISGRSLPSFPPYDPSPRAGGFVDGRFMTGIRPQEFFYHCMAGREGLIDTAVKTSRSGYLQRCLVKHLEGITVNYDLTVRDSDGSIVQYLYGEDGMEVTKSQFLISDQLPFLTDNIQASLNRDVSEVLKEGSDLKGVKKQKKSLRRWRKHFGVAPQRKQSPFSLYSNQTSPDSAPTKFNKKTGRKKLVKKLCQKWWEMDAEEKQEYQKMCAPQPDPVVARLQPDRHFGSVTEKLDDMVDKYMKTHGSHVDAQMFEDVVHFKALSALANPGEPVGLLAAQSIGEPSTQMTLNTFHFAGRGEMNVTLGIPRLREILMVASKNIRTPSMEIPFRKDVHKLDKKADHLRRKLTRVTLADVIEYVEVTEKLQLSPRRRQLYTLAFRFLPEESYKDNCTVSPREILKHFENKFMRELVYNIKNKGRKSKSLIDVEEEKKGGGGRGNDEEEEDADDPAAGRGPTRSRGVAGTGNDYQSSDDESEHDDDDATTQRRRDRQHEEHQYSDLEDEDQDIRDEIEGVQPPVDKIEEDEEDPTSARVDKREDSRIRGVQAQASPKKNDERDRVSTKVGKKKESDRINGVMLMDHVESYRFDTEQERWCEVTLAYPSHRERIDFSVKLKDLASRSVIREVKGIRKAFLPSASGGEKMLKTDGKNIMEMYNYLDLLDINRLYTNDIHAIAGTYGIEAASKVIVKEIQNVFKVYGITVDPRHLTLVADYMTFDGTFRPLSRIGMEGGSSPLQQMSFESSLGFLKSSVLRKKKDELLSPSARLMLGLPVSCGTSSFSLLYSLNEVQL